MATQITKTKMLELYERDLLYEIINTGSRIYAKVTDTEHEENGTVWCNV